jgi:hypothetical protein
MAGSRSGIAAIGLVGIGRLTLLRGLFVTVSVRRFEAKLGRLRRVLTVIGRLRRRHCRLAGMGRIRRTHCEDAVMVSSRCEHTGVGGICDSIVSFIRCLTRTGNPGGFAIACRVAASCTDSASANVFVVAGVKCGFAAAASVGAT